MCRPLSLDHWILPDVLSLLPLQGGPLEEEPAAQRAHQELLETVRACRWVLVQRPPWGFLPPGPVVAHA